MQPGTVLQHFIFFLTYVWAQYAEALDYTRSERPARDKHSRLLGQFVSYKKMKCCEHSPRGHIYNTSISSKLMNRPNNLEYLLATRLSDQALSNAPAYWGPYIGYKENEVLWIWYLWLYSQHFIFFVT